MSALTDQDLRFEAPLYTVAEAARVIGVASSRLVTAVHRRCRSSVTDGYATLIHVPGYRDVVCDPYRSFGRPIFSRGGVRVDEVLARFQIGESIDALTAELDVTVGDVEDALRVASRRAA